MSTPKNAFIENEMIENINSYSDIIKESSYMFYEFRDETIVATCPNSNVEYTKKVSPILSKYTVDNLAHAAFLDIIFEELPFYHKRVDAIRYKDSIHLSYSRDPAIADVSSFLHNSNLWNIWFRESQGTVHNDILLSIYNKLRYPFVNENQYLNITLFPRLAEHLYEEYVDTHQTSNYDLIEFKTTLKDNSEDIENGDVGCLDFIEDVVDQKIQSCYSLLDYHPDQAQLLDVWSSSMYWAGTLNEDDLEREKTIYKLQDVKYELLRRKFAGSSTLYSIALSAINRAGSFVNTTNIGAINTDESYKFRDSRLVRLLNLPGILTSSKNKDINIDPIKSFYEKPLEDLEQYIDLKLLAPMYFTSSKVEAEGVQDKSLGEYDAENFYLGDPRTVRSYYLRDKTTSLDWNSPESLLDITSKNYIYPKLDSFQSNLETASKDYLQLDAAYEDIANEKVTCEANCTVVNGVVVHNPIHLDIKQPVVKDSAIISSLLDVNADVLLYHPNTLQAQLQSSYPYVTYPIADNNSISLMDTFWMNYLESSTSKKSRVQDNINFGTQLSNLYLLPYEQTDSRTVFVLEDVVVEDSITSFVDLVKYDIFYTVPTEKSTVEESFKVSRYTRTVISRIAKALPSSNSFDISSLAEHDSFDLIKHCNVGLLPFTYDTSIKPENYKLGFYKEGSVENKITLKDDIKDHGLTKAIFVFSNYDNITTAFNVVVQDSEELSNKMYNPSSIHSKLSYELSENTKALYYVVPRYNADLSSTTYYWSSPVNIIYCNNFENLLSGTTYFHPDWFGMCYQLNPQLNFESNSASPLRRKNVFKAPLELDSNTSYYKILYGVDHVAPKNGEGGPSVNAALCNLARGRGYDFLCNDAGTDSTEISLKRYSFETSPSYKVYADKPWVFQPVDNALNETHKDLTGFFLNRFRPTSKIDLDFSREHISIYGDNRYKDSFDSVDDRVGIRSTAYVDRYIEESSTAVDSSLKATNSYCIRFHKNGYYDDKNQEIKLEDATYQDNRLALTTGNYWASTTSSNFSVFMHFRLSEILNRKMYYNDDSSTVSYLNTDKSSTGYIGNTATLIHCNRFTVQLVYVSDSIALTVNGVTAIDNISKYISDIDTVRLGLVVSNNKVAAIVINSTVVNFDAGTSEILLESAKDLDNIFIGSISENKASSAADLKPFYGCIYDLRLYNRDMSLLEAVIYNQGTLREQYSYNPSVYVLSNAIYPVAHTSSSPKNIGVLKQQKVSIPSTDLTAIDSIRVFNRSVWDTIIVDTCPLLYEELDPSKIFYSYDANYSSKHDIDIFKIEKPADSSNSIDHEMFDSLLQDLTPDAEVVNGLSTLEESVNVNFNGEDIKLLATDKLSLVTTTLHPTTYSDAGFISEGYLNSNVDEEGNIILSSSSEVNPIEMPINTVGDSLVYKADITLNLQATDTTNFECYFDAGSNIRRVKDANNNICIAHKEASATKNTVTNYVVLPFTIPNYEASTNSNDITLNSFALHNVTLHNIFNELLSSKNYYTEFLLPKFIPSTQYVDLGSGTLADSTEAYYASKWTGIRTLKPGTYYITCKYPFQIMPFEDNAFNTADNKSYTVHYGMVRFRLDVKYNPVNYKADYNIENLPTVYRREGLADYLSSDSGLYRSPDNMRYPHAEILIDLYAQKASNLIEPVWEKVASNTDTSNNITVLNNTTLQNSIILKKPVDLMFCKNYSMAAYIAGNDPRTPVLDNTVLKVTFNKAYSEKITASSEEDLKHQVLLDDTAYKLLFDYTAKITEFSFKEGVLEINTDGQSTGELDYYYKMKSLLTAPTTAMYNETLNITPFVDSNRDYVNKISGYRYQGGKWLNESSDTEYFLGDPNSKSSSYNKLYRDIPGKRFTLNDSKLIPYAVEGLKESNNYIDFGCSYNTSLKTVDSKGAIKTLQLDEFSIIKKHATALNNTVISKINELCSSSAGVLAVLHSFDPCIAEDNVPVNSFHKLGSISNQLQLYRATDRTNLITNRFSVTRTSLFSDNMLYNQNFADNTRWVAQGSLGSFVPGEDKDIYTVDLSEKNPLYLKWIPSSSHVIDSTYEIAANCPDSQGIAVFVAFLKTVDEDVSKIDNWIALEQNNSSDVYSLSDNIKRSAATIAFKFEGSLKAKISSVFARTSHSITEKHGLYNAQAPYKTDDRLVTNRHSTLIFRNSKTNSVYPVQFKSVFDTHIRPFNVENDLKSYILEPLDRYSSQPSVIAPWKGLIVYKENEYNDYKESFTDRKPTVAIYRYVRKHDAARHMYVESIDAGTSAVMFKLPDSVENCIYYDDDKGVVVIQKLQVINDPNSILGRSNLSIVTNTEGDVVQYLPASLSNEKVSGITNCFNVERYLKKETSNIAVTNIQYLDESGDIIYEIEYPPIIYDESKHHLSINAIFKRLAVDES